MTTGNATIPAAIVVAGALIAGALYFALGSGAPANPAQPQAAQTTPIAGVQADDHIIGNADAKVVIVEYSDTECPFCKKQHETLNQIVSDYAPEDVAWVYRNLPIPQLHSKAPQEAEALECAAELGGNDAFWKYTNRIYEITPTNNGLDAAELPNIAEYAGLDRVAFTQCLESGDMKARVDADAAEGWASGAQGTPHNIILVGDQQIPLSGYMDVANMKAFIDQLLAQ